MDSDVLTATAPHRTPPASARRHRWARVPMPTALLWSVLTALQASAWALDLLPHPFRDPGAAGVGALFNTADPIVGTMVTLVLGMLGMGCAALAPRLRAGRGGRAIEVVAWLIAGTAAFVLIHGRLLMLLGYTPVVLVLGWAQAGLWPAYLEELADPEILFQLWSLLGALVWGAATLVHRRRVRDACVGCGRTDHWAPDQDAALRARARRTGRIAVAVAIVCSMAYPAVRLPWIFGIRVGIDAESWAMMQAQGGIVEVGIALGGAAIAGAVLMTGLVADWGVRFPRWLRGLAGRRVPVSLAVVPATVVAIALIALGRGLIVTFLLERAGLPLAASGGAHLLAFAAMLPWGVALGVATAAYAVRRRAECGACGQGTPEPTGLTPRPEVTAKAAGCGVADASPGAAAGSV